MDDCRGFPVMNTLQWLSVGIGTARHQTRLSAVGAKPAPAA